MKKGKKIWNRLLSLVLCLVMVTGMFAGMGMEAKAFKGDTATYIVDCTQEGLTGGNRYENSRIDITGEFPDGNNKTITINPGTSVALKEDYSYTFKVYSTDGVYATQIYNKTAPDNYSYINFPIQVYASSLTVNVEDSFGNSKNLWVTLFDRNNNEIDARKIDGSYTYTGLRYDQKYTAQYRDLDKGKTYSASTSGDSIGRNGQTITLVIPVEKSLTINPTLEGKRLNNPTIKVNGNKLTATEGNYVISLPASTGGENHTIQLEYQKAGGVELMGTMLEVWYSPAYTILENVALKDNLTKAINASWNTPIIGRWGKSGTAFTWDALKEYGGSTENVGSNFELEWKNPLEETGVTTSWSVIEGNSVEVTNPTSAKTQIKCVRAGTSKMRFTAIWEGITKTTEVTITVNKVDPIASVTAPTGIVYGKYEGDFIFDSNVAGTFNINGKSIQVSPGETTEKFTEIVEENPSKGNYDLSWTFVPTDNDKYNEKSGTVSYTVAARDINDGVLIDYDTTEIFVYDGQEKKVSDIDVHFINGGTALCENVDYTVSYSNNINAGKYTAEFTITGIGNYTGSKTKSFSIQKAQLSVANAIAESRQYDGTDDVKITNVSLNNLAAKDNVASVVDLSNATAKVSSKNQGTYDKVTNLTGITLKDTSNYEFTAPELVEEINLNQPMTISTKPVTIENVLIKDTKVYDGGTLAEITDKGTLLGVCFGDKEKVNIVKGEANYNDKNVGENKTVTFTGFELAGEEASNYSLTQPASQTASITQKPLRMVEGSANVDDKVYDGTTSAEFSGTPALNSADIVENDDVAIDYSSAPVFNEIGSADEEKSVTVTTNLKITGTDAANYSLQIPTVTAKITNYTAVRGTDYTVNSNDWMNEDFVITAGDGCLISEGSQVNSQWLDKLTVTCDDDKSEVGTKAFYVKRADGTISRVVNDENAEYRIDKIDPTGEVKFAPAENAWVDFINTITFDLFYKDAQEVIITSHDQENLSGVASVEWYESLDKGMTLDEVKAITDWKDYDGSLIVALKDTKKFVYYVKITDKAGNVTYLSTDGAVYDITNPAITGIVNGETYYTTQVANVSDTNLKEVTLNSTNLTITDGKLDPITLEGNVDTEVTYTIVATDKAGNETTVSITMKPLSDLAGDITDSNVALEDEKELEKAEQILEEALKEENLPKITEEEEKAIREKLDEIQELLQELDEVKAVIKMIANLPDAYLEDGETVNPYVSDRMDDEEQKLYSAVKAAYNAYNKLSAHQQSLISTSLKHNLSNLRKVLTEYRIIDGDGKVWIYDTNGTITFTANGPVCRFENALVDGKAVPAEEMKVTKGSTVVELDAGYLYRLGIGNHTFQMEYTDGSTDIAEFSIVTMEEWNTMMNQSSGVNKTGGVATGDSANIFLWGAVLAVGAAGMVVAKKRRKDEEA